MVHFCILCQSTNFNKSVGPVISVGRKISEKDMGEGSVLTPEKMQNPYFWPNMGLQ